MPFDKYEVDDLGDLSGEFPDPVQEPEQQEPDGADIFNAPVEPVEPKPAPLNREKYEVVPEKVFYEQPAEEEHVPGQHSADRDGTGKKKSSLLFNLLFFGGILIAVVIFGWTTISPMLARFKPEAKNPVTSLEEERYKLLLQEREEMAKRLKIAEDKMALEKQEQEDRFARMLKTMQEADAKRAAEQVERDRLMREEMQKLLKQQKPDPQQEKTEVQAKTEPLKGSAAKTRAFDLTAATMEKRMAEAKATQEAAFDPISSKIHSGPGLRTASMIPAVLKTRIVSLYQRAGLDNWIVAETTAPIEIAEGTIPAGTRFLGKAVADYTARRMTVEIMRMQVGTTDIEMRGVLMDKRGNVGMVTKYVDPKQQAMWASLIPNLLSAAARASQDLVTEQHTDGTTGDTWTSQRREVSARNIGLEAAALTMENQAQLMQQISDEKQPIIIVEQGTDVLVQLIDRIPLELLIQAKTINLKK